LLYGLGSNVIITSRTKQSLDLCEEELKSQANQFGNIILPLQLDLEEYSNMDICTENLKRKLKESNIDSIDVIINNAGVSSRGLALDTTIESLSTVMVIRIQ
jgi:short-subunit dehydrogenase